MFLALDPVAQAAWERECGWDRSWNDDVDPADAEPPFESVSLADLPPLDTTSDVVAARLAVVRAQLLALASELPDAVGGLQDHELLDVLEVLQQATNLTGSVDQVAVAEIDRRELRKAFGATSTAQLLRDTLRVRAAEAKRRVTVARACSRRTGLTGENLPPLREHLAAALAAGSVSTDHADVIARVLHRMPRTATVEQVDDVEAALVEYAGKADPTAVAGLGRIALDTFDPDGPKPREKAQRRRRSVRLSQRDSGMGALAGDLTAELLVKLQTVLSPLAAPRPADANGEDDRPYEMRLHDAFEELCDRLLRSGTLPDSGGVPASVAVTIPLQQLEQRTGRVHTSHGGDLSVEQLLHLACDTEVIPVVLDDAGGILSHGRVKRFATAHQRKALGARDKGCSFPRCTRPPQWCDTHHVREWLRDHGDTDIDTMCLLCPYHHREFENWGWTVAMVNGIPWWTPPAHLDPEQKPVQNHAHDLPDLTDLLDR